MKKVIKALLLAIITPAAMNAGVSKPVPAFTTTIQTGQTYYLYNADYDLFVNRGENWYTRLCAGNFGLPFTLQTSAGDNAYFNIVSVKNGGGVYWKTDGEWNSYYDSGEDNDNSRFKIEQVEGQSYFHLHTVVSGQDNVFSIQPDWSDRSMQSWTNADDASCRWYFVTEADYQSYLLSLDAYASAYGTSLANSLCRKGVAKNYEAQSAVYAPQNGYICNGTTRVDGDVLVVTPLWNDLHFMEELPYLPSGRYSLNISATVEGGDQWCNAFMMGSNTKWQEDEDKTLYVAADLGNEITFNYDNSQGDLRVGLRSWNIDGWDAQNFNNFVARVASIDLTYRGSGRHSVTIGSAGYSTLFLPYAVTIPEGVTAYTGVVNGEYLTLTDLTEGVIPAETAVVLSAAPGTYIFEQTEAASFTGANDLKGDIVKSEQEGGSTYFVLASPEGETAFYKLQDGVAVPPFKSYLTIASSSNVKALRFVDDATGLNDLKGSQSSEANDQSVYNLAGQRLGKMQKGINVVNGRKVLK